MTQYIIRRLLLMIPAFFIVITLTFLLLRVAPGDAVDTMFLDSSPDLARRAILRQELGLDLPIYMQYVKWLGQMARFDFGYSLMRGAPVSTLLEERLPNSLRLGLMSIVIGWCIAIPIGILAAVKQDSWADYVARSTAILMLSVPNFFLAILVLILPAFLLGWSPPLNAPSFATNPVGHMMFLLTPAVLVGVALTGTLMRMTRAMMLEVLRADYIRTARAKGLGESRIILGHALKNALIPVVTILGSQLSLIIGGSVIVESIFGVPGVGQMLLSSVSTKDVSVVQTVNVLFASFILMMNLLVDISYAWLDPRIKYS